MMFPELGSSIWPMPSIPDLVKYDWPEINTSPRKLQHQRCVTFSLKNDDLSNWETILRGSLNHAESRKRVRKLHAEI